MILVQIWKSQKSGVFCTNRTNYQLYGVDLLFLTFINFFNLGLGWQTLTGSVSVLLRLSCSAECGILLPRPGIEPMFPALQGRFLTTGPQEKSFLLLSDSFKIFHSLSFSPDKKYCKNLFIIPFLKLIQNTHIVCILSHLVMSDSLQL